MPKFSKKEALSTGWQLFKSHWLFLIVVIIISLTVSYLPTYLSDNLGKQNSGLSLTLGIVLWIISIVMSIGVIKIAIRLVDGESTGISDLFNGYGLFLKYILTSIIYGIIVFFGLILFIIPGIVFAIRLQYAAYLVIDKNMGPIDAIKTGWAMTKGSVINLAVFDFLLGLITVLGALAFGVGLVIAVPVTALAGAYVYRKLQSA